ncbi:hypothetical protein PM082_023204 [Marasmius tenuissimus]|nr:hypothetical protein PM082_023204 [Marasmius tenuissimus]
MKFARYPPDEQTETNFASSPPYHHHTRQNTRFHQQPERLTNASTIVDAWQSVPISQEKSNCLRGLLRRIQGLRHSVSLNLQL